MTISIVLLICMTTCKHDFKNLLSYNDIDPNECVIYDTGLKPEERDIIRSRLKCPVKFIDGYFDGHFGNMRNRALDKVSSTDYIIFPDDSWAIEGFSRDMLNDLHDLYTCKIKNGLYTYDTCRIFKNGTRFNNVKRNEQPIFDTSTSICHLNCKFIDLFRDVERTVGSAKGLKPSDFGDLFHAGMFYQSVSLLDVADRCYALRLEQIDCVPEEKFLIYSFLALMHKDIEYYRKATEVYPSRAGEAWYYMYLVTGLPEYLMRAKKCPLGDHKFMINLDIYEQIRHR